MNEPTLLLSARALGDQTERYRPLAETCLQAALSMQGGVGTVADPMDLVVRIQNPTPQDWQGVIRLELPFAGGEPRFWLPGFLYGRNRGEAPLRVDTKFPRLRRGAPEFPAAPEWMARSDQLSHPAAFALADGWLYGLATSPFYTAAGTQMTQWQPGMAKKLVQYTGFTCSLARGTVGCTLGYEYAPWHFIQSHKYTGRAPLGGNCVTVPAGGGLCATLQLYRCPAPADRCVYDAVQSVYQRYHEPPRQAGSPAQAVADLARAVSRDAWLPGEQCYAGFIFEQPDGSFLPRALPSQTWTNGLTVAVPVLLAAHRLKDAAMREQALCCIGALTQPDSLNPASGLPYAARQDGVWSNRGWWFDGMHTAGHAGYLVGQAVYYLLKACRAEQQYNGTLHPAWLQYAEKVLTVAQRQRNADGEYPFLFSERSGAGLEYDALGSAWCLGAAALFCELTGQRAWLPDLLASARHYHDAFVARAECYGGPLDTDKAVDSEGVLALIRALASLHRLTGEPWLLDQLRDALCYAFTFQFCYNTPLGVPPLSKVGWSSCGGSITSTANPHIHPMSSTIIGEVRYYLACRADPYLAERLQDMILWSCQTYNHFDRQFDYGRTGWMSERFCYCEGLLVERYPDGAPASTWFALMPWACGSILEGLLDV